MNAIEYVKATLPLPQRAAVTNKFALHTPWKLTNSEVMTLDALCEFGVFKLIARRLDISVTTVNDHMRSAYRKMDVHNSVRAAILWERYRREVDHD